MFDLIQSLNVIMAPVQPGVKVMYSLMFLWVITRHT